MLGRELLCGDVNIFTGTIHRSCRLTRYKEDKGTRVEYLGPDGTTKCAMVVADAEYRHLGLAWRTVLDDIPEMENLEGKYGFMPGGYVDQKTEMPAYLTNQFIIQNYGSWLIREKSASHNTKILLKHQDAQAARHCDSVIIGGRHCVLPNLFELLIIFILSDKLDEMDPTAQKYPDKNLGIRNPNGRFCFENGWLWSSSEGSAIQKNTTCAWEVSYSGYSSSNGDTQKNKLAGVAPILELAS